MALTIFLLLLALGLLAYYIYNKNKKVYDLLSKIPGPPTVPILGNLLMFSVPTEDLFYVLRKLNKDYYPISKYWLGPYPAVNVNHPDDLEVILSNPKYIEKGFAYQGLHPWLKTGLVTSGGGKWSYRRKILTPAFHFKIIKKYVDTMDDNGKRFINLLRDGDKENEINLLPFFLNITLNVICESAMGIALDKIDKTVAKKYKNACSNLGDIVIYRAVRPYIRDWMLNSLVKMGRIHNQALQFLHEFTKSVLLERKEFHKRSDNKFLEGLNDDSENLDSNEVYVGRKRKLAMLDLLLSAEKDGLIDDTGIQEELDTFVFAGHETIATTLTYAVMLLAEHEDIQNEARAEVNKILSQSKGELGTTELQELNLVERCLKESLRLYPPIPGLSRRVDCDIKLKHYIIPAGTEISCHIVDLHRDPNFWEEPNKFDPDRFLPERFRGHHPYSFIPFSAGPRNCIGQKFAMMELKSLLARILYNFKLEPVSRTDDMKLVYDLTTRPSKPVFTRFVRIDSNN